MNSRYIAAKVIEQVIVHRQSLDVALSAHIDTLNDKDQSFVKALCFGVIRYLSTLQDIESQLLGKAIKSKDHLVRCLIWVGLYQIHGMRVADHAAISQTVAAAKKLKQPWAKGLINALLRRFAQDPEHYAAQVSLQAHSDHPLWLVKQLKQDWPEQYPQMIAANNQQPPMFLRVNCQSCSREDYLKLLSVADIDAEAVDVVPDAIRLCKPQPVSALPNFQNGWASVQDLAPQMAAELLELAPKQSVLDACAAPGGKSAHILEVQPELALLCADHDEQRLLRVQDNLNRLQLKASVITADMLNTQWWNGQAFDRILLDAPCSATGVIRRHPDIKWLRQEADIAQLAHTQLAMLNNLWSCLAYGGVLLYATCSVLRAENDGVIQAFIAAHPDAELIQLELAHGVPTDYGWQLMPQDQGPDGFYYAKLKKSASR